MSRPPSIAEIRRMVRGMPGMTKHPVCPDCHVEVPVAKYSAHRELHHAAPAPVVSLTEPTHYANGEPVHTRCATCQTQLFPEIPMDGFGDEEPASPCRCLDGPTPEVIPEAELAPACERHGFIECPKCEDPF